MSADDDAYERGDQLRAAAPSGPCAVPAPADRIVRQIQAIDAWNAARRLRERALAAGASSRYERMDVSRCVDALARTQAALAARSGQLLHTDVGLAHATRPTAVVAHRHAWFVEKVALLLDDRGVTVVGCTDNGAEALGVVVAEQPDLVLAGDRLAMMTGAALLADTRLFAPWTLRAAQAEDGQQSDALRDVAHTVFLRHQPPAVVVDALVALHRGSVGTGAV